MALSTPSQKVSSVSTATGFSIASASFTPTANALLLVVCTALDGSVNTRTASGCSGTHSVFTEITQKWQGSANRSVLTCAYWGIAGASPGSAPVTVHWTGQNANRSVVQVYEMTGHNVSDPIGYLGSTSSTGSSMTVTMNGTPLTASTVIGVMGSADDTNPNDIGEDGTFTLLSQVDSGGSTARAVIHVQYDANSADDTVSWSNLQTLSNACLAFEVLEAGGTTYEDAFSLDRHPGITISAVTTVAASISLPRLLALSLATTGTFPGVHTFTDGYQGDAETKIDTLLSAGWPIFNGGAHESADLDPFNPQRFLLRFDLSSIPSTYQCIDATLYLYRDQGGEGGGICSGSVYSISSANSSWIEGTKNIALASAGEPTWNSLAADGNSGTSVAWAGSAGLSTAGTDYETNSIGNYSFLPSDPTGTEVAITLDPARIKGWFGASNTNYGIILITGGSNNAHVGSSDNATTGYRPKLVVHYSGEPVTYENSLTLSLTKSIQTDVIGTYFTSVLLGVIQTIETQVALDIPTDINLLRLESISTESLKSIEETLTLSIVRDLVASSQGDLVASIGLPIFKAMLDSTQLAAESALSLNRQLGINMDPQTVIEATLGLSRILGYSTDSLFVLVSEISMNRGHGITSAAQLDAQDQISLNRQLAISVAVESIYQASINLARTLTLQTDSQMTMEEAVSLLRRMAIVTVSEVGNQTVEASLVLARTLALSASTDAVLNAQIDLEQTLSITMLGGLLLTEAISLNRVLSATDTAQLDAVAQIGLGPRLGIFGDNTASLVEQLSMGKSVALSTSVEATLNTDINLGRILEITIQGGLQYDAAITLGILQGLSTVSQIIELLANIPAKLVIGDQAVWLIRVNDKLAPLNGIINSDSPQSNLDIEDRDHV